MQLTVQLTRTYRVDHPLASCFSLQAGAQSVTFPEDLRSRDDYILVLLRDSENIPPRFITEYTHEEWLSHAIEMYGLVPIYMPAFFHVSHKIGKPGNYTGFHTRCLGFGWPQPPHTTPREMARWSVSTKSSSSTCGFS
ncbi:hypothetical protein JB92DRAFT_1353662 [Gautieria morchelliformis]|nr:hypothetical protein JB92DRAFT_1353662 [Gautieria morchelliformis]